MANEEFGADLITLVDDEGHEHEFEIVDTLELGEQHYVALVADCGEEDCDCEDDGELVILKSVMEGEEEFLEAIEDEAGDLYGAPVRQLRVYRRRGRGKLMP